MLNPTSQDAIGDSRDNFKNAFYSFINSVNRHGKGISQDSAFQDACRLCQQALDGESDFDLETSKKYPSIRSPEELFLRAKDIADTKVYVVPANATFTKKETKSWGKALKYTKPPVL